MSIKFRDLHVTINVQEPTKLAQKEEEQAYRDRTGSLSLSHFDPLSMLGVIHSMHKRIDSSRGTYPKEEAEDGVYIMTSDNICIEPEFWGLHSQQFADKVVGCAVIEGDKRILIAPDEADEDFEYASEYEEIPGLKPMGRDEAKADWNGKENTEKLLKYRKSEAAMYCNKYGILNRVAGTWHLPALAEMIFAQKYIDRVNACLTLSGKTPIKFTDWYWSSTQYSGTLAWILYWSGGYVGSSNKSYTSRVRAFAAL